MTENSVFEDYHGKLNPLVLIPKIGSSFKGIHQLEWTVRLLERWQYKTAMEQLEHLIKDGTERVNALLLKGEVYALFEYNKGALEVFERVLQEDPDNVYALTHLLMQLKLLSIRGEKLTNYAQHLKRVAPTVYNKLQTVFSFIEQNKNKTDFLVTTQPFDVICVCGHFLYDDGTMPPALEERLKKTYALAIKHPQATIVLSGGAVQNEYCEAQVMKQYLLAAGIDEKRIEALETAKDTVGNIIEFMDFIKPRKFQHICVVSSAEHLPRAWMSFMIGMDEYGYSAYVSAVAPSDARDSLVMKREHQLNYQTVLRVAGLFEKKDIQRLL